MILRIDDIEMLARRIQIDCELTRSEETAGAGIVKSIVGEVDSLKALVDEFSQFARMPAPRSWRAALFSRLNQRSAAVLTVDVNSRLSPAIPTSALVTTACAPPADNVDLSKRPKTEPAP